MPADEAPRRSAQRKQALQKQALQSSRRTTSTLARLNIPQVNWDEAVKDGGYQSVGSLRSVWNKLRRTKLAPGESTPKKRKAGKEGGEERKGETPTKKRGKGARKDKKADINEADTNASDGAGEVSDEAEHKVKTEGEEAV